MRNTSSTIPGTAVVAGGAGFIGSHLCETLLNYGGTVICVDRFLSGSLANIEHLTSHPRFHLVVHDICQPFEPELRPDRIYNLACSAAALHHREDPVHTMMTGVLGTHNLLHLAKASGARFLHASTCDVFPTYVPGASRFDPADPRSSYEQGIRAAETLCFDARRQHGIDTRIARIFSTYGRRMPADDEDEVARLITKAQSGEDLEVPGNGSVTRSFCHISDLVRALLLLMERPVPPLDPVDLGNPEPLTLRNLAETVLRITGAASRIIPAPSPPTRHPARRPDIRAAGHLLGWQPHVGIEEGLRDTIRYFNGAENVVRHPRQAAAIYRSSQRGRSEGGLRPDPKQSES
jgi:UDP-glucuronate decarboxylase